MNTILLVEDDPTIRLTMEFALSREGHAVISAADGREALKKYKESRPDLILLDLMIPKVPGLEVARLIRLDDTHTPIVMVTALGEDDDIVAGLDAGADDYLTKPFSTKELLARVRAQLRRVEAVGGVVERAPLEFGSLSIDVEAARVHVAGEEVKLRVKEYGLLVALASRPGALATRQWLSHEVWGEEFLTTSRTIDVHVRRLRSAIEPYSSWEFIQTVHGMGYRFQPAPTESDESAVTE